MCWGLHYVSGKDVCLSEVFLCRPCFFLHNVELLDVSWVLMEWRSDEIKYLCAIAYVFCVICIFCFSYAVYYLGSNNFLYDGFLV